LAISRNDAIIELRRTNARGEGDETRRARF